MNKAVELEPCPFCGYPAITTCAGDNMYYKIACSNLSCPAKPDVEERLEREARDQWNARATPTLESIIAKIEAEKWNDETGDISCRYVDEGIDKAISIIREEGEKK